MIESICFLMAPSESGFLYPEKMSMLPLSLGLGVLTGYLRGKGLEVGIADLNTILTKRFGEPRQKLRFETFVNLEAVLSYLEGEENEEIDSIISGLLAGVDVDRYDSFGISVGADLSLMQIHGGFLIGRYLQKKYGKTVFIGGNNVSFLYIFRHLFHEFWPTALKYFPFVVKGAGEQTIWDVISGLNDGEDDYTINNINGLVRLIGEEVIANPEYRPQVVRPDWDGLNMDYYKRYMYDDTTKDERANKATAENLLCFYKWPDTFPDSPGQMLNRYNKFKGKNVLPRLVIPYIFNYNCPFNCAFCTQSDFDRGSVVGGDPEVVLADIITLMEKYNTNYFYFVNNSFNFSAKFVDNFCQKVIAEGIKIYWSDCGRFNNLTYERLKLMRDAGCVKLTFGLDTASEKMLKLIDKKLDLAHSEQVLKWCHELGIWADIEVILGMPQEFDEDFAATFSYIERNYEYINYFWVNEYFVVPNSLIGRYPERYGIELIKDRINYRGLLKENLKYFRAGEPPLTHNAKLYGYNELGGRSHDQIVRDNNWRISDLNKAQRKEFNEVSQFYKMLTAEGR